MNTNAFENIDEYIASFPPQIQSRLGAMRELIRIAAPDAIEAIKYRMPTFVLGENLVHFAAFKKHIGFYPTASGIAAFQNELTGLVHSKGAIQFPLNKPLPPQLIGRIVKFRVKEATERAMAKSKSKKSRSAQ